jgi:hypothetical protein
VADLRAAPGGVRPGAGGAAVGRPRARVPGLPGRDRGGGGRARPPAGRGGGDGPARHPRAHLQPLLHRPPGGAGRAAGRPLRRRRQGVPVQLGSRGQRGRHQGGPALEQGQPGRAGHRDRGHPRRVPRPHPGHPGRHRQAGDARPVPAAAARLLPRALRGRRRHGRGHRAGHGGGAGRADPGRGRDPGPAARLPAGRPRADLPGRGAADRGRDPVRDGPHRPLLRPPARRDPARRGHHGQGARLRLPDRGHHRPHRGGRRHAARRPRHHLRRQPGRLRGRPGHPGRDRAAARRPCRQGLDPARRSTWARPSDDEPDDGLPGSEVRGAGLWFALDLGPEAPADAKQAALAALGRGLVVNPVTDTALRLAPPLVVTEDEVDEGLARLGAALEEAGLCR